MTEKRFTKCGTKIRDNGEEMSQAEVRDMLNSQNRTICNLNSALSHALPVWVITKVINRRIQTTTDENVQKELKNLLEELK